MDNQIELNKIASAHLGKAGDGSVVKPYITPDSVDPTLLVSIPRKLNRQDYGIIEEDPRFVGIDAWNAYEFSTLLKNGFPVSGWLKFSYGSETPNIVESKSVKLYLNSFNMAREMETLDDIWSIEDRIASDLSKAVGGEVMVGIYVGDVDQVRPIQQDFTSLETYCDVEEMVFDKYNETPDIFEIVESNGKANRWRSHSLRSNCRVTNQPDWGDVYISIKGSKTVTPESLLQYIVSMRKENHFHEEICECIYVRLYEILQPDELFVGCLYTRRGGVDINPVRANNNAVLYTYAANLTGMYPCLKTPRQ